MGLIRLIFAAALGAAAMLSLPRAGVLAATQEIIAFLSLLMAGLLPAMTLTATILRGSGLSAKRVQEYGGALLAQLRFWAFLFGASGLAVLGISFAKIFSTQSVSVEINLGLCDVSEQTIVSASLTFAGAGLGVVILRLRPAYAGLVSLLQLNVKMAQVEAIAHDRTLRDAITAQSSDVAKAKPYSQA